jgi:molecular chaperone DnaK (HSP70)
VQRDAKMVSYKVIDKASKPYVSVNIAGEDKTFSPEEISAMVLIKVGPKARRLSLRHVDTAQRIAAHIELQPVQLFLLYT